MNARFLVGLLFVVVVGAMMFVPMVPAQNQTTVIKVVEGTIDLNSAGDPTTIASDNGWKTVTIPGISDLSQASVTVYVRPRIGGVGGVPDGSWITAGSSYYFGTSGATFAPAIRDGSVFIAYKYVDLSNRVTYMMAPGGEYRIVVVYTTTTANAVVVGGLIVPVNKLAIVTPWVMLLSLVGGTAALLFADRRGETSRDHREIE